MPELSVLADYGDLCGEPIMPFGPQAEPAKGMAKSYAGKS